MKRKRTVQISSNKNSLKYEKVSDTSSSRVMAFIIDWILSGICAGIPSVIAYLILTGKSKPLTSMYQFGAAGLSSEDTILISIICILFGCFYYVVIPWKIFPGQTIGKKITHLRIISTNDNKISLNTYFWRQFVFLILIEGAATPVSTYVKVIITTLTHFYVDSYLGLVWDVITLISVFILFWGKNRMSLHDCFTKTVVIKMPIN